jgi:predicted Zn-dependent protease
MKQWSNFSSLKICVISGLFFFSAVTPLNSMSPAGEVEIGKEADKDIIKHYGYYNDKDLQEYVSGIGQKLISYIKDPVFEYYFKVIDSPEVNAFALPGGYIYVTRGMLAYINSEAELSVILGHEIGHVTSHHAVTQMNKSIASALLTIAGLIASQDIRREAGAWVTVTTQLSQHILSGYGREAEMQSDELGIIYSHSAGYDPRAMADFFRKLKSRERFMGASYHGFLATHPDTIERIIAAEDKSGIVAARGGSLEKNENKYKSKIEGLSYGGVSGNKFKKTDSYIHIYTVKNGDTFRTIAKDAAKDERIALEIALINGKNVDDTLTSGEKIKIIMKKQ